MRDGWASVLSPKRLALLLGVIVAAFAALTAFGVGPLSRTLLDCTVRSWLSTPSFVFDSSMESTDAPRARSVSPADLLSSKHVSSSNNSVPRLFHQSWKTTDFPARFQKWSDTWRVRHPEWHHVLWTDDDNRELVYRYYPEYVEAYDSLPREIYRADMIRNLYMHRFGGVYVDLDLECLEPIDSLLETKRPTAFVARMGNSSSFDNSIPNAFLASTPGHSFWLEPVKYVRDHFADIDESTLPSVFHGAETNGPERLTGPIPLFNAVNARLGHSNASDAESITVLPEWTIFPYSWHRASSTTWCACSAQSPTLDTAQCKAMFPRAFALSYWSQSWGSANWAQLLGQSSKHSGMVIVMVIVAGIACVAVALMYGGKSETVRYEILPRSL